MKLVITQSNYIPWKGYFELIAGADRAVIYDEVQYTKNDWRNRNMIKTPKGKEWITIPVRQESLDQRICDTQVAFAKWNRKHLGTLQANYAKAGAYSEVRDMVFGWYEVESSLLSEINMHFIRNICNYLHIGTELTDSRSLGLQGDRNERLIDACKKSGADTYLSGPAARDYIDSRLFSEAGIAVEWMDYDGYPEYGQLHPPFEHGVSVLDLIFNEGTRSRELFRRTAER